MRGQGSLSNCSNYLPNPNSRLSTVSSARCYPLNEIDPLLAHSLLSPLWIAELGFMRYGREDPPELAARTPCKSRMIHRQYQFCLLSHHALGWGPGAGGGHDACNARARSRVYQFTACYDALCISVDDGNESVVQTRWYFREID